MQATLHVLRAWCLALRSVPLPAGVAVDVQCLDGQTVALIASQPPPPPRNTPSQWGVVQDAADRALDSLLAVAPTAGAARPPLSFRRLLEAKAPSTALVFPVAHLLESAVLGKGSGVVLAQWWGSGPTLRRFVPGADDDSEGCSTPGGPRRPVPSLHPSLRPGLGFVVLQLRFAALTGDAPGAAHKWESALRFALAASLPLGRALGMIGDCQAERRRELGPVHPQDVAVTVRGQGVASYYRECTAYSVSEAPSLHVEGQEEEQGAGPPDVLVMLTELGGLTDRGGQIIVPMFGLGLALPSVPAADALARLPESQRRDARLGDVTAASSVALVVWSPSYALVSDPLFLARIFLCCCGGVGGAAPAPLPPLVLPSPRRLALALEVSLSGDGLCSTSALSVACGSPAARRSRSRARRPAVIRAAKEWAVAATAAARPRPPPAAPHLGAPPAKVDEAAEPTLRDLAGCMAAPRPPTLWELLDTAAELFGMTIYGRSAAGRASELLHERFEVSDSSYRSRYCCSPSSAGGGEEACAAPVLLDLFDLPPYSNRHLRAYAHLYARSLLAVAVADATRAASSSAAVLAARASLLTRRLVTPGTKVAEFADDVLDSRAGRGIEAHLRLSWECAMSDDGGDEQKDSRASRFLLQAERCIVWLESQRPDSWVVPVDAELPGTHPAPARTLVPLPPSCVSAPSSTRGGPPASPSRGAWTVAQRQKRLYALLSRGTIQTSVTTEGDGRSTALLSALEQSHAVQERYRKAIIFALFWATRTRWGSCDDAGTKRWPGPAAAIVVALGDSAAAAAAAAADCATEEGKSPGAQDDVFFPLHTKLECKEAAAIADSIDASCVWEAALAMVGRVAHAGRATPPKWVEKMEQMKGYLQLFEPRISGWLRALTDRKIESDSTHKRKRSGSFREGKSVDPPRSLRRRLELSGSVADPALPHQRVGECIGSAVAAIGDRHGVGARDGDPP